MTKERKAEVRIEALKEAWHTVMGSARNLESFALIDEKSAKKHTTHGLPETFMESAKENREEKAIYEEVAKEISELIKAEEEKIQAIRWEEFLP